MARKISGTFNLLREEERKRDEGDEYEMYLLHPTDKWIENMECFSSMSNILQRRNNKPVDLLIISINAQAATQLLLEVFDLYAMHSILIVTAGFAEVEKGGSHKTNKQ
jgi:hypothetical protein